MPPKIRELIRELRRAGFRERSGKGSHRVFKHPTGIGVNLSGQLGADAKKYQIKNVRNALRSVIDEEE